MWPGYSNFFYVVFFVLLRTCVKVASVDRTLRLHRAHCSMVVTENDRKQNAEEYDYSGHVQFTLCTAQINLKYFREFYAQLPKTFQLD